MAKTKLIRTCAECATPCCKTGPGPYEVVSSSDYLEGYGTHWNWNKKCEGLTRNGKCRYWKTKDLPEACRVHVCPNRFYSSGELELIAMISSIYCPQCEAQYMLEQQTDTHKYYSCESCDYAEIWQYIQSEQ